MAHPQQQEFFENTFNRFHEFFSSAVKVLEVGSQDINGNVRSYFQSAKEYVGVDLGEGNKVDYVIPGELLELPKEWADMVVTTECLEHAENWKLIFLNMIRILKPSGLFLMTCASLGRAAHGTIDSEIGSSPFTTSYYKNLGVEDVSSQIDLIRFFDRHSFEVEAQSGDLYFWGVRNNKSFDEFLLQAPSAEDRLARAQGQLAQVIARESALKLKFSGLSNQLKNKDLEIESLAVRAVHEQDLQAKEKGEAQQAVEELKQQVSVKVAELEKERKEGAAGVERMKALEGELFRVKRERDALAKEKGEAQKAVEQLQRQVSTMAAELDDERNKRGEAQKVVEELKQQVSAKVAEQETEKKEKAAIAERLKALDADCALLQHELASYAAVLKRVQKSRDDHAQRRYGLAQQINELKSELTLKNGALQDERSKAGDAAGQIKALMAQLAGVKGERDVQAMEKGEAREEAELTLLQLHLVQEELERYFLESRAQDDLLRQHQSQSLAMRQALSRLIAARS